MAQQLNWAHRTGGPLIDLSQTVYTDNAGDVYIAGKFSGTNIDFDPSPTGSFLLSSVGSHDIFVAKYSPTEQFIWAFRIGGADRDGVIGLTIDNNNNFIYITGYFRGPNVDFDPGPGTANLTSNGDAGNDPGYGGDMFVAKYSLAGAYQWAFNVGGTDLYDSGLGIATDAAGGVYVGGYFNNAVDFNPGPGTATLNSASGGSIFLAKYTSAGAYQWAFNLGSGTASNNIFDLTADPAGNVYATGYYQGTNIDFDPGPGTALLSSNGGYELFVAKYNANGQYQFAFDAGGSGSDVGRGIAVDNAGNVYVIGDFTGPNIDFDPGPGVANLNSNGQSDIVLAKYNSTGQYQWAFNFGGTPPEFGGKVIVEGSHLFVSGNFSGTADMDPSAAVDNLTSAGLYDIFVGKYTLNGEYLCSFRIGGPGDDNGYAVYSPSSNVFYLTGAFPGTNVDFDPGPATVNLSSAGDLDIYLAKYTWPDNSVPAGTISGNTICSGGQAQLIFNATAGVGPFTIVYNNGVTNITQTNVQSGVPFNITPSPTITTTYTLVSIRDAMRCSETNFVSGSVAVVTVTSCTCDNWLNTPSNGSKVTVGDLDITGNQVTVEALFNRAQPLNSGVYYGHLVSKHTDVTNVNYALLPNGCEITTTGSGYQAIFQSCPLQLNRTYHVAMVYNGSTLKYYRDGYLLSQIPCTGNIINNDLLTTIGQVAGGTDPTNNQFLGFINEVRIWNVERTQIELQTYMNTSLPNPTTQPGLKAYYSFNDLLNKQGNASWNGSLAGAASINQTNPNCSFTPEYCNTGSPVVIPDFTVADTVCVNTPVTITNTSTNATTFYWNFCSGSLNAAPTGTNFTSPNITSPVFMDLVQDGPNYYVFVVNHTGSLSRMDFGNSLLNAPTTTNLGSFGSIIPFQAEGIEIQKDGNNWIGYLIGGQGANSRLVKLSFGNSLSNVPTATNLGNIGGLNFPVDLTLFKDGTNWYGFTVSADNNTVTRFTFGNSLNNIPVATNLGNVGGLNYPEGIFLIKNGNNFHLFVTNRNSNSVSRLDFGTSLANVPAGTNLGNPGNNMNLPRDITVIRDCDRIFGFVTNEGNSQITRLDFNNNMLSIPSTTDIGNVGTLSYPHSISEIFRTGDAVNFFIANVTSNSISRLTFNNCTSSTIPSYPGATPPPFQYTQPGTYNISLFIDEGLPTQSVVCKQIVVKDCGRILSGVINDYTEVLAFDPCKNSLTVANANAYNIGDTVLIIQMKGAVVDSTNTAAFGTIIDYKNAGNYEFNYVKSKTGNIIELKHFLTRSYDIPYGRVQLVRVPFFQDAIVSSTLTCLPWDGGKGGVVAFNVANALQLNANIDASGKGFRGGAGYNSGQLVTNCFTNGYYYPLSSGDIAGIKGESVSTVSNNIIRGKGALAGAGGGGLDHNSGGGGGGNGGSGGFGGYQLEPCGNAPFDNRGIGGKNLVYNNAANKIFMGSGGGAGHANNPANSSFPSSGGNGSGIVIISAQSLRSNSFKIIAEGANAPTCNVATTNDCHDAMGGGGGGGTVLLNIQTVNDNSTVEIKGGKGGDMSGPVPTAGRIGSGGGGGGGVFWSSAASLPANVIANTNGGLNGVLLTDGNSSWGATPGNNGINIFNLQLPLDIVPFKPNIDSVRIKDSITGCSSFDFKGFGYINNYPVASWQWYFGDGNIANTQNTSHTYTSSGTFTVKLVVTDINGCKDSITKAIATIALDIDFSYQLNSCSPLTVQFNSIGTNSQNPYWSFGDATTALGVLNPVHTYPAENNYIVKFSASNGVCTDTVTKTISLAILPDDIVLTNDTTICFGATKQLLTKPSLSFCWSPATYLNNPSSPNPITSTPQNITYYYTAEVTGNNLIVNGDFTQGNTGFTSQYNFANPNSTEGQYFIGTNPQAWNGGLNPCGDHTTGNANMMMVNGAPAIDVNVWKQTVTVIPNTNYAFSTWIQALTATNPAQLQFSINGKNVAGLITASTPACTWAQFYTTWNSGNNTTAIISIVNKNTVLAGNDFALDDISFAPVFIKRDSVRITIDTAAVRTNNDVTVCAGTPVQLNTTGAVTYSWTPSTGLSNTNTANPIASPVVSTQYFVTGTNLNGCTAKDSVTITTNPKPAITKSRDTIICKNVSVQLSASGGTGYLWSPAATLNDPAISNPVASPTSTTTYYVTVTGANTCSNVDSVKVSIRPDPVFTISSPASACEKIPVQLTAGGGNTYSWQPASSLSNSSIANPIAIPLVSTNYSVQITETTCNTSAILTTTVTVKQLPAVQASKSNDLDCTNDRSQLTATGAQTYIWSPSSSLNNPAISNPVAAPAIATMYLVKGTDASGCSNYDSVLVDFALVNPSGYFMPNAFTPNGDGKNDCYGIRSWGIIQDLEFSIYNRWGERVFFTKNPNDCWDGNYKGKRQSTAVFVYMIKAKTLCGSTFKKGLLTLIR